MHKDFEIYERYYMDLKKGSFPNKLVLSKKLMSPKKYSIPKLAVLDLLFVTIALSLMSKALKPY